MDAWTACSHLVCLLLAAGALRASVLLCKAEGDSERGSNAGRPGAAEG